MIKIDRLSNHPQAIPALATIWHEVLGKIWMPEIDVEEAEALYHEELRLGMPITYVALSGDIPVGSCTFQLEDEIRPDLGPWIGDLVVHPKYQKQGIGKRLLEVAIKEATARGFRKMYLFAFDPAIPKYYERLGWKKIGSDTFKSHPVTLIAVDLSKLQ